MVNKQFCMVPSHLVPLNYSQVQIQSRPESFEGVGVGFLVRGWVDPCFVGGFVVGRALLVGSKK